MSMLCQRRQRPPMTRRDFLAQAGGGFGSVALAWLLNEQGLFGAPASAVQLPHRAPLARRVIQLFMLGGASQCDTFDYK
ncbi:MAG: DUF1501 domain-containing protein, partial [Verrucomicrobia bacterium]|nr:DUF1501 domain-containing protein [Verrucomicrobiota bacterium]